MGNETQNLINLVTDVQNGVEGAFEKLYHESFRHAYCTASLLLKSEQDIEDVLQNSYMYVAKYIKDLKNPESFNNWLGVIVKHECQKYIMKQKRVSDIFVAVKKTKEFELIDENNLPVDYIEKSETRDAIQRIVDDLPPDKQACIVLFYYEQHSLTEISEILGVPEGTVMSRLYYARKKLEKEFKKLQKKDESLFGISVIPLIVSLFAYQTKTAVISPAIESGIITAVTSAESAAVSSVAAGTAVAAIGSAAAGASTAGAAGTAVATKVAAVAVAASVAVGGGVATVNHIKNTNEAITTQAISTSLTEEHATVTAFFDETTLTVTENTSPTAYILEENSSNTEETKSSSTHSSTIKSETSTIKPSTTKATTTSKPTTTKKATTESTTQKVTTAKETTTKKETTTQKVITTAEPTTNATDVFSVSDGVLSEYTGAESNVTIPSAVGSSTVTSIGTGAFAGNTDITSVTIPSTVTRIGLEAFSDCTNLRSVSLPSSLNSIGVAAFYGCSSLTSVTISDGTQTISDEAFSYCTSLSSITIPDSVTSISEDAFYGSDNVTIRCSEGSTAHDYAVANSIKYELI